ncbi:MAG: hypothetical protein EXR29_03365 [Betaproteobacteria bacterium]|nr:hypothetical protein [Betaproteobacteria bacterium]
MMQRLIACLAAGLIAGTAFAKLPPAAPKTDAEKAAQAEKDASAKSKEAGELGRAQDKAAANYRKNRGIAEPDVATMAVKKK